MNWILRSSADPAKTAASVKALLLGLLPLIMFATGLAGDEANSLVEAIANIVFLVTSLVSPVWFLFGIARKIYLRRWSAPDM